MIYDHLETDFYKPGFLSFLDMLFWGAEFSWIQASVKVKSSGGSNRVSNKQSDFELDLLVCYSSLLLE